jgi:hypothetical protein
LVDARGLSDRKRFIEDLLESPILKMHFISIDELALVFK